MMLLSGMFHVLPSAYNNTDGRATGSDLPNGLLIFGQQNRFAALKRIALKRLRGNDIYRFFHRLLHHG